jgi:hypothetical protein
MINSIQHPITRSIRRNIVRDPYADADDNALRLNDEWQLVTGKTLTYNVAEQLAETRTGWALHEPPSRFTISNTGIITATLPHLYTARPTELTIITDQGNIRLPTAVRDWFPGADFDYTPTNFFSIARAHDGAAEQTLFSIAVLDPNDGTTRLAETDVQSGADGYLDENALRTLLNDITDGVIVVSRIRDQISGHWVDNDDNRGALGYINNGSVTILQSVGGKPLIRGRWNAANFNNDWSADVGSPDFRYRTTDIDLGDNYFHLLVIRNTRDSYDNRLGFGDGNRFPAIKHSDLPYMHYYLNNNDEDPILYIDDVYIAEDWKLWEAFSLKTDASQYRKGLRYYVLETQYTRATQTEPDDGYSGDGLTLLGENFEFCEWAIFHVDDHDEGNAYRTGNFRHVYARNAAAVFAGESINY